MGSRWWRRDTRPLSAGAGAPPEPSSPAPPPSVLSAPPSTSSGADSLDATDHRSSLPASSSEPAPSAASRRAPSPLSSHCPVASWSLSWPFFWGSRWRHGWGEGGGGRNIVATAGGRNESAGGMGQMCWDGRNARRERSDVAGEARCGGRGAIWRERRMNFLCAADASGPCRFASLFGVSGIPCVAGMGSGRRTPYWTAGIKRAFGARDWKRFFFVQRTLNSFEDALRDAAGDALRGSRIG
jgi:hypothetical protein